MLLELKLEGELDGAGAADLVKGLTPRFAPPEPRLLASVCVERPNRGLFRVLLGIAEVRVGEDVEELGSKTKPHAVLPGN